MEEERMEPSPYIHIESNEFSYRRHKRQKAEDIAVCECQYDIVDPESPCGERCLNVHTNTECTPGYCHCGVYCKNQDASEAFLHLPISLRDEFSHCYVPHRSSLADITMSHSKVYKQREGNQPECKPWKQNLFGPLMGLWAAYCLAEIVHLW